MTQQQSSNYQSGYMCQAPPPEYDELNVDKKAQTQNQMATKTKTNAIHQTKLSDSNANVQHTQPPLRAIASAPEAYHKHNSANTNHSSPMNGFVTANHQTTYHQQHQQQQYQNYSNYKNPNSHSVPFSEHNQRKYTSEQLRRMYEQYQDYYNKYKQQQQQQQQQSHTNNNHKKQTVNNNNDSSKYVYKSHSEYIAHLIKTVRDQTEEINGMQETILSLRKKISTSSLLEEDFYSFLSRIEFPQWISEKERALCLNKLFLNEKQKLASELCEAKLNRREEASKNLILETKIIELSDDISTLRDYLEQEKHQNYLQSVSHNLIHRKQHKSHKYKHAQYDYEDIEPYPPENIVIQNLIRTQIEFYFSDYNLKRDKRLLDQLCSDRIGFLKIDSVMNLTRVRQLSSHRNQVINSLRNSKFLSLTNDAEWVGRMGFERPVEKQFPFRRTVFVFGLPMDCGEKYVTEMLSPFGKLSKVKFDHGPDTLDRLVSENLFGESKVYQYREMSGQRTLYNYKQEVMVGGSTEYNCNKCNKLKQCDEGFYETNSYQILVCLQCAAAAAELILEKCKQQCTSINNRMIELLCGKSPRNTSQTKTALAVFTSQRQASKCVYVRSRIAYDGCFATHYHHYSKLKKEIALTLRPFADKLRQIPPRRMLQTLQQTQEQQTLPPILHNDIKGNGNGNGNDILLSAESKHSSENEDNSDQSDLIITPIISNKLPEQPKLQNSAVGSLTAPVVGGKGEIYLMRRAYNKVNN